MGGEIEVLTAAHLKEIPGLDDALGACAARVKEAEEALKKAVEAHRVAYVARSNATARFDTQRGQLEARLVETAAPEIDAFCREMLDEWERVRSVGSTIVPARRNWHGAMEGGSSNFESVSARLRALQAAPQQAEELKLRALDREELAAELDRIRGAVPQVEA